MDGHQSASESDLLIVTATTRRPNSTLGWQDKTSTSLTQSLSLCKPPRSQSAYLHASASRRRQSVRFTIIFNLQLYCVSPSVTIDFLIHFCALPTRHGHAVRAGVGQYNRLFRYVVCSEWPAAIQFAWSRLRKEVTQHRSLVQNTPT